MTTEADLSMADRLSQVLDHLGMERAHFAASMLADVTGFAQLHTERIASLTLVCPPRLDPSLRSLGSRLLIIAGDQGRPATMVRDSATNLPRAMVVWLPGYFSPPWADVVADHTADIESALLNVVSRDQRQNDKGVTGSLQGAFAGITYHIQGEGPPWCCYRCSAMIYAPTLNRAGWRVPGPADSLHSVARFYSDDSEYTEVAFSLFRIASSQKTLQISVPIVKAGQLTSDEP